ncbi:MAG: Bug family tripartite tricarboxylate transporter substrate binding protein [bacterium]|jgi:tripartite-type tricarboxylate transporter receptor subunit TctC
MEATQQGTSKAWISAVWLLTLAPWLPANAQTYPTRPVRLVIPFGTGGSADISGRLTAQKLSEALGQTFVVDNRGGAGGILGTEVVARAAPDGYTLLLGSFGTHTANPSLYKKLPYDPIADFAPVSLIATVPNVLVLNPSVPARSVPELVALAKATPKGLIYASSGGGTGTHLAAELFKSIAGIEMVHVPYKAAANAISDVISGQVQLMFSTLPSVLPQVKAGKLRALGITTSQRSEAAPDIPPIAELLKGYEVGTWFGILAPRKTPRAVVNTLAREIRRMTEMPDVRARLHGLGAEPVGNTPEVFEAYIRAELPKWAKVIAAAGITPD